MSTNSRKRPAPEIGRYTEQQAKYFLMQQGLNCLAENVRYKFGEIDLVMQEQSHIIFVEVRYRRNGNFGGAIATISQAKQARLVKAAQAWLQKYDPRSQFRCRFDMIAMTGHLANMEYQWLKNIFQ